MTDPSLKGALYWDASQPAGRRAEDLLSRMTLAEKVGQMPTKASAPAPIVSIYASDVVTSVTHPIRRVR
ncbi:MAG TPA: hypothetical protein VJN18_06930 [Polyangiaceae bacterium]|nr:hypothetical protein [Polyangiaceae bacterium]